MTTPSPTRHVRKSPIRKSGFSAENIPAKIKTGIGELIMQWSYVAFQVGVIIRVGLGIERDAGFALLSGADLQPLCRTLRTLARSTRWISDKSLRREIMQLADDIQKKKDRRHEFAHGVFGLDESNGKAIFVRYRFGDLAQQRKKPASEIVTAELLQDLADEAYDLGRRAQNLTVQLKALRR
jgi:hypothetical protein